jgi:hypothetical protein
MLQILCAIPQYHSVQGPVWARALGSKLIADEEFCMQLDAHMDFAPDFDIHMLGILPLASYLLPVYLCRKVCVYAFVRLGMWVLTENEYAVLSTYVSDSATMKDNMPGKRGTNNMVRLILLILRENYPSVFLSFVTKVSNAQM